MTDTAQLTDAVGIQLFATAGNAHFTIVNPERGTRYTFRVRKGEGERAPWFVSVLTGPDNGRSYQYLGHIFWDTPQRFHHGRKSRIGRDAPSARCFAWFWTHLCHHIAAGDSDLDRVEFWHEGRCGRCGRRLTVPESIETGIGPVCAAT